MAMSHSLIYRVCRGGDQCQTVRPGRRTARIKTRSRVSLQKSHTQMDVRPPSAVAGREDAGELHHAVGVGDLDTPQVVLVLDALRVHRVPALAVAMPDVHLSL